MCMKKFLDSNNLPIILFIFLAWRIFLFMSQALSESLSIIHKAYIGPVPIANFDGIHYLSIAKIGYQQYEQVFFRFFPFSINIISSIFKINYLESGIFISHLFVILSLYFLWKLVNLDFNKKIANVTLLFFLFFPTSFFLGNIYSESLFLFFVFSSFYFARKKNFIVSSIMGAFASATRVVGIFMFPALLFEALLYNRQMNKNINKINPAIYILIVPVGILVYMYYLLKKYSDPLIFVHSQAVFTGRTGGQIILLPQVIWRYIKIFLTVPFSNYDYWISLLEFFSFAFIILILYLSYKSGIRKSYIIFSSLAIIFPTLSGTFQSIPRYLIASFVVFIFFSKIKNKVIKYSLLAVGCVLEGLLAALFYRGYFVG